MSFLKRLATTASSSSTATTTNTEEEGSSYPTTNISKVHPNDVLCGRGGFTNNHVGNIAWRMMVAENQQTYSNSSRRGKTNLSTRIVTEIRSQDPPGRFLKKDDNTKLWNDIGDREARKKTSQALREGVDNNNNNNKKKRNIFGGGEIKNNNNNAQCEEDQEQEDDAGINDLMSALMEEDDDYQGDDEAQSIFDNNNNNKGTGGDSQSVGGAAMSVVTQKSIADESLKSSTLLNELLLLDECSLGMGSMSLASGPGGGGGDNMSISVGGGTTATQSSIKSGQIMECHSVSSRDISCASLPLPTKDMLALILEG